MLVSDQRPLPCECEEAASYAFADVQKLLQIVAFGSRVPVAVRHRSRGLVYYWCRRTLGATLVPLKPIGARAPSSKPERSELAWPAG